MNIRLRSKIYPIEAILNACYIFIDRAYIYLDSDVKGDKITVSLREKQKSSLKKSEQLKNDFMQELLYASLRCRVSQNNKKIREYIIGRALYSTLSPLDSFAADDSKDGLKGDPLGIAIPWEQKHGKKRKNKLIKKHARVKV